MDERGLIVDPNRDPLEPVRWWEKIGETQRPSPYNRASWVCIQEHEKELVIVPLPGSDPPIGMETTHINAIIRVYDTKASNPEPQGLETLLEDQGDVLGHLSYEIVGNILTITDWSHNNWQDASPVKLAFNALKNNLPDCVLQIMVREPKAFWKSLGFFHPSKNSDLLIYFKESGQPVPY